MGKRLLFLVATLSSLFVLMALAGGCTKASVTTTTAGGGAPAGETTETTAGETTETTAAAAPAEKPAEAPAEKPAEGGDDKALVEKICAACHGLKGITGEGRGEVAGFESFKGQSQVPTARDWEATVTRMKDVNKCPMTDDEKAKVTAWLNANVK